MDNLKIFNVKVEGEQYDESMYAKKVAEHLKLNLIEEVLNKEIYLKLYKECICLEDLPLIHPNSVGVYLISKRAKKEGIDVLLSGEGADELFGGYSHYKTLYRLLFLNKIHFIHDLLNFSSRFSYDSNFTSYIIEDWVNILRQYNEQPWIKKRYNLQKMFYNTIDFLKNDFEKEVNSYMMKDLKYYLVPLLRRSDRMSMGNGLEMRVPYLDDMLLDFTLNLPLKYKISIFHTKYLLKKVAERYLPKKVVYRKKMGFALPISDWLEVEDFRKKMLFEWMDFYKN